MAAIAHEEKVSMNVPVAEAQPSLLVASEARKQDESDPVIIWGE